MYDDIFINVCGAVSMFMKVRFICHNLCPLFKLMLCEYGPNLVMGFKADGLFTCHLNSHLPGDFDSDTLLVITLKALLPLCSKLAVCYLLLRIFLTLICIFLGTLVLPLRKIPFPLVSKSDNLIPDLDKIPEHLVM